MYDLSIFTEGLSRQDLLTSFTVWLCLIGTMLLAYNALRYEYLQGLPVDEKLRADVEKLYHNTKAIYLGKGLWRLVSMKSRRTVCYVLVASERVTDY